MTPEEEAAWVRLMRDGVPYRGKTDLILAYLRLHPEASAADVAAAVGCSKKLVYHVRPWPSLRNAR